MTVILHHNEEENAEIAWRFTSTRRNLTGAYNRSLSERQIWKPLNVIGGCAEAIDINQSLLSADGSAIERASERRAGASLVRLINDN